MKADNVNWSTRTRLEIGSSRIATYLNQVDLVKRLITPWLLDIENADDVFVIEVAQELHLTKSSETKHGVVKGGNFLDGDLLARGLVYRRARALQRQFRFLCFGHVYRV